MPPPSLSPPSLSLYAHLPWCVRKCPYCDFNSHELKGELAQREYVDALLVDLEQDLPLVWGRTVNTVFIGGGTPSLFAPESIDRLLQGVRSRLTLRPDAEVTLEANPGTVEHGPFAEYLDAGVSRLSFGMQSFDDSKLRRLGRIHSAAEGRDAIVNAKLAGFDNLNVDLMFGLPGQTSAEAVTDIQQAIDLAPSHVSHYQLTLEPNTQFAKYPPVLPDDDQRWAMQEACHTQLAEAGYGQYEVSAFARPGWRCQHNENYWSFGDYLGIGAGAHGKITLAASQIIQRTSRVKQPQRYLAKIASGDGYIQRSEVSPVDRLFEFALNSFRLRDGFPRDHFTRRTGLELTLDEPPWSDAIDGGLLEATETIRPSERGWRFHNDLVALFLPHSD